MQSTQITTLQTVLEAQNETAVGFHDRPTLIEDSGVDDTGRECKLFLTSLLLTSAIATFALTSLPQLLPLSKSKATQTAHVEAIQANPVLLNSEVVSPSKEQTVTLIMEPSTQSTSVTIRITASADPATSNSAIALSQTELLPLTVVAPTSHGSDNSSVNIAIQPGSNANLVVATPETVQ